MSVRAPSFFIKPKSVGATILALAEFSYPTPLRYISEGQVPYCKDECVRESHGSKYTSPWTIHPHISPT